LISLSNLTGLCTFCKFSSFLASPLLPRIFIRETQRPRLFPFDAHEPPSASKTGFPLDVSFASLLGKYEENPGVLGKNFQRPCSSFSLLFGCCCLEIVAGLVTTVKERPGPDGLFSGFLITGCFESAKVTVRVPSTALFLGCCSQN